MPNESNEFDNRSPFSFAPHGSHDSGTDFSSAAVVTIPTGARKVMIQTIDQNIRLTLDGTTPTTSSGFRITAGRDPIILPLSQNTTLTIIEETATAVVEIQFGY